MLMPHGYAYVGPHGYAYVGPVSVDICAGMLLFMLMLLVKTRLLKRQRFCQIIYKLTVISKEFTFQKI